MLTAWMAPFAAATLAAWLGVLVTRPQRVRTVVEHHVGPRLLIVTAWTFGVFPSLLQLRLAGRTAADVSASIAQAGIAVEAIQLLTLALVMICAAIVLNNVWSKLSGPIVLFLAPWALMMFLTLHTGGALQYSMLLFPLIGAAFWTARPPMRVLSTLGVLTIATAVIALGMGLWTSLGTVTSASYADKAIIGGPLLAGPFNHPNALGLMLVLGLPSIFLVERAGLRRLGLLLVLVALLWSASRTSVATAGLILVASAFLRRPTRAKLAAARLGLVAGAVTVCWVPLHASTFSAYSFRGQIWLASRAAWHEHQWLGLGPDYYRTISHSDNALGTQAFHGHNLLIHLLTTGGLVAVVVVGVFLVFAARHALRAAADGQPIPLLTVFAFLSVSVLEVVTDFRSLSGSSVIASISLAAVFFSCTEVSQPVEPQASKDVPRPATRNNALGARAPTKARLVAALAGSTTPGPVS